MKTRTPQVSVMRYDIAFTTESIMFPEDEINPVSKIIIICLLHRYESNQKKSTV